MALSERAIEWLESRGLDPEIASAYGVESYSTRQGEAIGFAYMLHGEHVNTKFRSLDDKRFWMVPDGLLCLWNAPVLEDQSLYDRVPLIITEGEVDALTAIQCGFPCAVSVPNGAPAADSGEAEKRYGWFDIHKIQHREVIVATDSDSPGARLRRDLELRLGRVRCCWVRYPDDCKDLNDVLVKHGREAVVKCLVSKRWAKISGLYRLDELPPEPEHEILSTGMPGLDQFYRLRIGEMTVISGPPNSGKTEWACGLVCSLAMKHSLRPTIGSFEDHPRRTLVPRLMKWHQGMNATFGMPGSREAAEAWVRERFAFISPDRMGDDDDAADLFWLLERLKAAVIRHESRLVLIDPWNEIEHDKPPEMTLTEYVGYALRAFKRFAFSHDVHVIIVAHPSKAVAHRAREGQPMGVYDIADSAHWVNKPDAILILDRDAETNITGVYVKKIRFQPDCGRPGTAYVSLNRELGRYESAPAPGELDE